ncbi:MAG: hypothetical protein U0804_13740 [Gemmataceae bacterium]
MTEPHSHPTPPARRLAPVRPGGVSVAEYGTEHELRFYLAALRHVRRGALVVVIGLRGRLPAAPPAGVRLILTADGPAADPAEYAGCFVPDPALAVAAAAAGLGPREGLLVLLPADWRGPSPDTLLPPPAPEVS